MCGVTSLWPDVSTTLIPSVTRGIWLSFGKQCFHCTQQEAFREAHDDDFVTGSFRRLWSHFTFKSCDTLHLLNKIKQMGSLNGVNTKKIREERDCVWNSCSAVGFYKNVC